jgi:hypothetical protein
MAISVRFIPGLPNSVFYKPMDRVGSIRVHRHSITQNCAGLFSLDANRLSVDGVTSGIRPTRDYLGTRAGHSTAHGLAAASLTVSRTVAVTSSTVASRGNLRTFLITVDSIHDPRFALRRSGAGVANMSLGVPDIGRVSTLP